MKLILYQLMSHNDTHTVIQTALESKVYIHLLFESPLLLYAIEAYNLFSIFRLIIDLGPWLGISQLEQTPWLEPSMLLMSDLHAK